MADPTLCRTELEAGLLVPLFTDTVHEVSYTAYCRDARFEDEVVRRVYDRLVEEMQSL